MNCEDHGGERLAKQFQRLDCIRTVWNVREGHDGVM